MQALKVIWCRHIVLLNFVFTIACNRDYQVLLSKRAPDGNNAVEVFTYGPYLSVDERLRVQIKSPRDNKILYQEQAADLDPCFAEIAWSPDSKVVGVIVRNCAGSTKRVSYDLANRRQIADAVTDNYLREAVKSDYSFKPGEYDKPHSFHFQVQGIPTPHGKHISDPLVWVGTDDAATAFRQRLHARTAK